MKYTVQNISNYQAYSVLTLSPSEGNGLWFEPGQYVTISADGILATPTRCFSIVSSPHDTVLRLAFRVSGDVTQAISRLRIDDSVSIQGPFGDFTLSRANTPVVFLASGIGVTPFMSMLQQLIAERSRRPVIVLASNRSIASTPFHAELRQLIAQLPNGRIAFFTGDRAEGAIQSQITKEVLAQTKGAVGEAAEYYICGPATFSYRISKDLAHLGVPEEQVISEIFSQASNSVASRQLIRKVVYGSVLSFASLAALITGVDMIVTHNKAEAAYAQAHPAALTTASNTPAATQNTSADSTSGNSSTSSGSSNTTTTTPSPSYYTPTQTYAAPSSNYYYSPPVTSGS